MKRLGIMVATGLLVSACNSSQPIVAPDGSKGAALACNGLAHSWGDCFRMAGEACPNGYDVLTRDGEAVPIGAASVSGTTGSAFGGSAINRSMTVKCH